MHLHLLDLPHTCQGIRDELSDWLPVLLYGIAVNKSPSIFDCCSIATFYRNGFLSNNQKVGRHNVGSFYICLHYAMKFFQTFKTRFLCVQLKENYFYKHMQVLIIFCTI